ncbi:MAG TPA: GGDEF domain-containing protein [Actinomadura sp.]|nr:GGDEF domain-containing protein [Actinomadura sp.]
MAGAALVAAVVGVRINWPSRRRAWVLFLIGLACRFVGDVIWAVLVAVLHVNPFPSVADAFYLASFPLMAFGLALMVRSREPRGDHGAALDTAIIVTGTAVLVSVFVIAPTITETTQDLFSRAVSTAYPVGDLVLLAVLARLWTTSGLVLRAYRFLGIGLLFFFAGDIGYDVIFLTTGHAPDGPWFDLSYLLAYAFLAAATLHPSMRGLTEPAAVGDERTMRPRLVALAIASSLAPAALLIEGLRGRPLLWQIIAPASILLAALVITRLGGLLQTIQRQATQLAAMARTDGLTGVPNRRSWDMELPRALTDARAGGPPVCVGLLDLDHFKTFNDTYGHPAGDALLKQAAAAWRSTLPAGAVLARYGGEEFAVLLRGHTWQQAHAVLEVLRAVTPLQQSFSAGLVSWDGSEEPPALVTRADEQLYEAKRAGRGRTFPPQAAFRRTQQEAAHPATAAPADASGMHSSLRRW